MFLLGSYVSFCAQASNACGYIQDAFRLLLPVLQHAALQSAVNKSLS